MSQRAVTLAHLFEELGFIIAGALAKWTEFGRKVCKEGSKMAGIGRKVNLPGPIRHAAVVVLPKIEEVEGVQIVRELYVLYNGEGGRPVAEEICQEVSKHVKIPCVSVEGDSDEVWNLAEKICQEMCKP